MGKEVKHCTIISGAPEMDIDYYKPYVTDSFIICADSGYLKCEALGITPDLIIGDFDSSPKPELTCEIIELPVMKDDTDTFSAVKEAVRRGYSDITILGAVGSRLDHTYSNVLCLDYCLNNGVIARIINQSNVIMLLDKPAKIVNDNYTAFSVFAMFGACENVSIKGAVYKLDGVTLSPTEQYTQSNSFKNACDTVEISLSSGRLLVILSND